MVDEYTNKELQYFEKQTDNLILWLFDTRDKRYVILKILKECYNQGGLKCQNMK